MNQSFIELARKNPTIRAILAVVATLFVGALGSGLWELFLKELFLGLGNWTLSLIASLWGGYVDRLHAGVGKLRPDLLVVPLFAFFASVVIVAPWYLIRTLLSEVNLLQYSVIGSASKEQRTTESIQDGIKRIRRKILRVLLPLACAATAMFLVLTWQVLYTREASTWAERSIDIVAPYISSDDRIRLR